MVVLLHWLPPLAVALGLLVWAKVESRKAAELRRRRTQADRTLGSLQSQEFVRFAVKTAPTTLGSHLSTAKPGAELKLVKTATLETKISQAS
jgi:hypothetical protein